MSVRVRFAPSPTGFFHVGSARTSLFNWLFARHEHGTFILRIEDTDAERNRPEWSEGIVAAMAWLGLGYDEGPYFQSALLGSHHEAVEALVAAGHLYACDCTREQIDERARANAKPGYDGHCRERRVARAPGVALRFRVPDTGVTVVHDIIRGDITFPHEAYEDFIVVKGNGVVLYPLANAVDDRAMAITHVIRGEDLLPTTPKQVMMWEALNACGGVQHVELPEYAHLPLLVNESRKKLSKRKDPVSVESYREAGYLPEAVISYLALLGWSPRGGEEIVSRAELVAQFRLEDVSDSPAFFDLKKMAHVNAEMIRAMDPGAFAEAALPWLSDVVGWMPAARPGWAHEAFDRELWERVAPLVQTRVSTLGEIPAMVGFFFAEPSPSDEDVAATLGADARARVLVASAVERYGELDWTATALHEATAELGEAVGVKLRQTQAPVRLAVTGSLIGPPLFESMALLGRETVIARLERLLAR